jgi:REP element-mobilizing transposase RayT
VRLKEYDYSQAGAYFITICTRNRECLFGEITDGQMALNEIGQIVNDEWKRLSGRFFNINTAIYQIMPNHIHGIISVGATLAVALPRAGTSPAPTIGGIVGAYKSLADKQCRRLFSEKNEKMPALWQRSFYEHIIRDDEEYRRVAEYIVNNPVNWAEDSLWRG